MGGCHAVAVVRVYARAGQSLDCPDPGAPTSPLRRRPAFWHRFLAVRWFIPLIILVAAVCFFLYTFEADVAQGHLQTEKQAVAEMTLRMTHLNSMLEYLLQNGQVDAARKELSTLSGNPTLRQ